MVRAAAISAAATLISAVSHTLGGGAAPHPLLILAVATLLIPLTAALIGARNSTPRVVTAVLLAQGVFHLLFQSLGAPTGGLDVAASGHAHHVFLPPLDSFTPGTSPDAPMLLAHLIAAAFTAVLVVRGEAILSRIAAWFQALLRRAVDSAPADHGRPGSLTSILLPAPDAAISAAVSLRGPPLLARG